MKKAALFVDPPYRKNRLFDLTETTLNRDNCMTPWVALKQELKHRGIDLRTHDDVKIDQCAFVLFTDYPIDQESYLSTLLEKNIPCYLILFESEVIKPYNWNREKHKPFRCIFTWNDDWVDHDRYRKFYWPVYMKPESSIPGKSKFCCMISGHKKVTHPNELYTERIRAARYFEQYHPDRFDLFGIGWENRRFPFKWYEWSQKKLFNRPFPSYQGEVDEKNKILRQYRYSICYENANGIPGYITEKIFDSLCAYCIPIYDGASNIQHYVPEEVMIVRNRFDDYESLYRYLDTMSKEEYESKLNAIHDYLVSDMVKCFQPDYFARTLAEAIC